MVSSIYHVGVCKSFKRYEDIPFFLPRNHASMDTYYIWDILYITTIRHTHTYVPIQYRTTEITVVRTVSKKTGLVN